jgi:hypothetical protein
MDRIEFLKQGLEVNELQATLISELISDIPDNQLKNFLIFRMQYIEPMMSKELITKRALFDYRKIQTEKRVQSGERVFETVEDLVKFVETYYKGKDLGSGLASYEDFVIIGVDKEGNLLNKFVVNEYGNYLKLDSSEEAKVYKYLFENQNRIGDVKYYTKEEIEKQRKLIEFRQREQEKQEQLAIEHKNNSTIDKRVFEMINKIDMKVS